ncbi:hypothetical protein KSP40_PGU022817 [Platanthera guangdongensis]|uniref:Uncharacterized protein n=1 Tax=Platanthera guangdongensis TaxID=2320717 RepID=A0ABR2M608_9ASPA
MELFGAFLKASGWKQSKRHQRKLIESAQTTPHNAPPIPSLPPRLSSDSGLGHPLSPHRLEQHLQKLQNRASPAQARPIPSLPTPPLSRFRPRLPLSPHNLNSLFQLTDATSRQNLRQKILLK